MPAAALLMIATIGVLAAVAAASGSLPVSPTYLDASQAYDGLQVEPARITYTGDGSGFLGGAVARDQNSGIIWAKWASNVAMGTGFNQLDDCTRPVRAGGSMAMRSKSSCGAPGRSPGRSFSRA
jgi:hypothetical protein